MPSREDLKAAIRRAFRLRQDGDVWIAEWLRGDGVTVFASKRGNDRQTVIRQARADWGHFFYPAEAQAFAEIFPPQY